MAGQLFEAVQFALAVGPGRLAFDKVTAGYQHNVSAGCRVSSPLARLAAGRGLAFGGLLTQHWASCTANLDALRFMADDSGGPDTFLHATALEAAGIDTHNIKVTGLLLTLESPLTEGPRPATSGRPDPLPG